MLQHQQQIAAARSSIWSAWICHETFWWAGEYFIFPLPNKVISVLVGHIKCGLIFSPYTHTWTRGLGSFETHAPRTPCSLMCSTWKKHLLNWSVDEGKDQNYSFFIQYMGCLGFLKHSVYFICLYCIFFKDWGYFPFAPQWYKYVIVHAKNTYSNNFSIVSGLWSLLIASFTVIPYVTSYLPREKLATYVTLNPLAHGRINLSPY